MPKVRLTQGMRFRLGEMAKRTVVPSALHAALDAAYGAIAPLVRALVEKRYPPKDMRVLAKYGCGKQDHCIRVQMHNGVVEQFQFKDETGPHVVRNCTRGAMYIADEATSALLQTWVDARDLFDAERKRRVAAYRALIDGSKYLEDITEVWPEAEIVRPAPGTSLIPLNPEAVALIRADVQERMAA